MFSHIALEQVSRISRELYSKKQDIKRLERTLEKFEAILERDIQADKNPPVHLDSSFRPSGYKFKGDSRVGTLTILEHEELVNKEVKYALDYYRDVMGGI